MKTLYFECNMGAAGDMLMAALLELHDNPSDFVERLNGIGIPNVAVSAEPSVKCGITGTRVRVRVHGAEENIDEMHEYSNHDHSNHKHLQHEHAKHHHNSYHDIEHLIEGLNISDTTKRNVLAVYQLIAEAESHAHGVPASQIHFHEVGEMDAVTDCAALIKQAHAWGHKAVAITDHGVVQGFTDAFHTLGKMNLPKDDPFKVLYGCEIYLVDDKNKAVGHSRDMTFKDPFVLFHMIKTGKSLQREGIVEISAVKVIEGEVIRRYHTYVNPEVMIPHERLHKGKYSEDDIRNAPNIQECLPEFAELCKNAVLISYKIQNNIRWLNEQGKDIGISFTGFPYIDTTQLSQFLLPDMARYELAAVCKRLKIPIVNRSSAYYCTEAMIQIHRQQMKMLESKGIRDLEGLKKATDFFRPIF